MFNTIGLRFIQRFYKNQITKGAISGVDLQPSKMILCWHTEKQTKNAIEVRLQIWKILNQYLRDFTPNKPIYAWYLQGYK